MDIVITFILGILVRVGLPLAVTVGIFYVLRRLDERWRREALAVPVAPRKPCWEIKGCSEEKRKKCPATAQPKISCWQVFRTKDGLLREDCLGCDVFRQAPVPVRA